MGGGDGSDGGGGQIWEDEADEGEKGRTGTGERGEEGTHHDEEPWPARFTRGALGGGPKTRAVRTDQHGGYPRVARGWLVREPRGFKTT
ncbi:hypothetical protein NL676_020849 [Syzygium grande]|nr:hypothetical protein NL676_020849 [Syzygium grande]